eukprot:TRINITY_DN7303_c0_g1_i1.p1 TRINITY_DN7303_c0_g1~~TRINITY_DN7303_c0_g1_i1.p1  ORF type:complete len:259 (-),score=48.66 TRINITY_DN7303_c0_g1_i1:92-868(-)
MDSYRLYKQLFIIEREKKWGKKNHGQFKQGENKKKKQIYIAQYCCWIFTYFVKQIDEIKNKIFFFYFFQLLLFFFFFFFKQKTAYEIMPSLVGSEMCIRDRFDTILNRVSMRSYQKKDVDDVILQKIMEYVNLAPSAGNLQAFSVKIVKKLVNQAANCRSIILVRMDCNSTLYNGFLSQKRRKCQQIWGKRQRLLQFRRCNYSLFLCLVNYSFFTHVPVSYTHLTLPTICSVQISVVAVSLKKKKQVKQNLTPQKIIS